MLLATVFVLGSAANAATDSLVFGERKAFEFEALTNRARVMAAEAYQAPALPDLTIVDQIDYDAHGKLHYRRDCSPYCDKSGAYPLTFFHLGRYFTKPVRMHVVENGYAREIIYQTQYFEMPEGSVARKLSTNIGFAGFRLHEHVGRDDWKTQDWAAFLGASYFRAIGDDGQYGLSARGIAVNTACGVPEEFPDFREFYIEESQSAESPVTVCALLDGPSITGAVRMKIKRGSGVTMEMEKFLFLRKDIERLGIAPITSMFWYSEQNKSFRFDWRPEVHDSDGLELWTGGGERIWRQLNNPEVTRASAFSDTNPRGFGLMQRDRDVAHYHDGVRYHRRPSLWVEPIGDWGKGAVQLIEIPTDDEIHDNIAAFWVPDGSAKAGNAYEFRYRLSWQAHNPFPLQKLAHAVAIRMGRGGNPGAPRPQDLTKFSVEFEGDILGTLAYGEFPEILATTSRGEIVNTRTEPIMDTRIWRAEFDLRVDGADPVDLRMFLKRGDAPMSETWMYQHLPALHNQERN
jgi:glucans biosynthesis protein